MRLGLRGRFTLAFAGAALVPIVAGALVAWTQIADGHREDLAAELAAAHAEAQRQVDATGAQVARAVGGLATRDDPLVGGALVELMKGGGEPSPAARRRLRQGSAAALRTLGLDVLVLATGDGRILAAPHFPARVDDVAPDVVRRARVRPGAPAVTWDKVFHDGAVRRVLVVSAARAVDDAGETVVVVAGRALGSDLITPLARGRVHARLVAVEGGELAATTTDWRPLAGAPARTFVLRDAEGAPVARLTVAASDDELRRRLRRLGMQTAALGALAILGAAALGLLVARRMTHDLDALVVGVHAVSRGALDVQVPVRTRDEVGQVAAAFNAMTRELADSKDRLLHAERVAAWQEIARSLAHELKNPLTPIQMSVETVRKAWTARHPSFDDIFDESTGTVLEEVGRLKRIVGEFSRFARLPRPERRPLDLNDVVASAVTLYRGAVRVVRDLAPALPPVAADRDQLTQVVLNLLENARDAVASKGSDESIGRITVRTRVRDAVVMLEVEDNGPGFDPSLRDRLFGPYFTTKDGGTGLGLAIVQRIVAEHAGRVAAQSDPGRGARFVVELPAASTVAAGA